MIERNGHIENFIDEEKKEHKTMTVGVKSWAVRNTLFGAWHVLDAIYSHLLKGEPFRLLLEHKGDTGDVRDMDHIYITDLSDDTKQS